MSEPMKRLFYWLTGGRPMHRVCFTFIDVCTGKPVYYFRDAFNNPWLANHKWSLFRVRPMHGPDIWESKR